MFIDSHCHVNFSELAGDLDAVTAAMAANNVTHALCVCVNLEHFDSVLAVAQRYSHGSLGSILPNDILIKLRHYLAGCEVLHVIPR